MENAAQALIIAGAVLIAILILSMGVYLRNSLNQSAEAYFDNLDTVELEKYNAYFTVYDTPERKEITAQEIVSLISIVQQKEQGTKIYIDGVDCSNWNETEKNKFLENNILKHNPNNQVENAFSYDADNKPIAFDENGKVIQIGFKKI
jgi:hypothetical protein